MTSVPAQPKIYHIVHIDRLPSIMHENGLLCDAKVTQRELPGTTIGLSNIKERRRSKTLESHADLHVGSCVPFYFCPRSVMLFMIERGNHDSLSYKGGQKPIIHLVSDLHKVVKWARTNKRRWVITLSNAGSHYFKEIDDLNDLDQIDWSAIQARCWKSCKEKKQAEFLIEDSFPWHLVESIGVLDEAVYGRVRNSFQDGSHQPIVEIKPEWYY